MQRSSWSRAWGFTSLASLADFIVSLDSSIASNLITL
jgi:hypothetical protein